MANIDQATVEGFGDEWTRFDQSELQPQELEALFSEYFAVFPWQKLPPDAVGFDMGCGSGRWAKLVSPRVGKLHCIDASGAALMVAKKNLQDHKNCEFHQAAVDAIPLPDDSMDFAYSLGVLHHVPNTQDAIQACVRKLKSGAPFLVYLYYRFDNRPMWFAFIWQLSNLLRLVVSRLPHGLRYWTSQLLALLIYWPLARTALALEKLGVNVSRIPLSHYRNLSFYTMRTDALDRFGTRLEQRFTAAEIVQMFKQAGLENIKVSTGEPYWCVVGEKI